MTHFLAMIPGLPPLSPNELAELEQAEIEMKLYQPRGPRVQPRINDTAGLLRKTEAE